MEFQILASNAKCTYSRKSVGTLLYLSIRGVQGVIIINMMLMVVHALKKFLKSAALPHSGSQRKYTIHHSRHKHHTLAYMVFIKSISLSYPCTYHTIKIEKSYMPLFYPFKSTYQSLPLHSLPIFLPLWH
jgi:uncharacterized membrane protein